MNGFSELKETARSGGGSDCCPEDSGRLRLAGPVPTQRLRHIGDSADPVGIVDGGRAVRMDETVFKADPGMATKREGRGQRRRLAAPEGADHPIGAVRQVGGHRAR